MHVCDINPHIRFAARLHHDIKFREAKVTDCRLFYVLDGEAALSIEEKKYYLKPKSVFYCCAGSRYIIETQTGFSLIAVNFDLTQENNRYLTAFSPETSQAAWETMPVLHEEIADSWFLNSHLYLADGRSLGHYLEIIVSENSACLPFFRETNGAMLKMLLTELHRQQQGDIPPKIAYICDYMQQHFAEKITNKQLAALVGYHEYYFNRIFLTHIGTSLHNYLLKVRLNKASDLILNTDLNLNVIPELTGFGSYPHFSRYFKLAYGYSPSQYRKRFKSNI